MIPKYNTVAFVCKVKLWKFQLQLEILIIYLRLGVILNKRTIYKILKTLDIELTDTIGKKS